MSEVEMMSVFGIMGTGNYAYRVCKFVTRLLETVYPEMVYTDVGKKKDETCFVHNVIAFCRNVL